MLRTAPLVCALCATSLLACQESPSAPPAVQASAKAAPQAAEAPSAPSQPKATGLEILDAQSKLTLKIEPKAEGGYRMLDASGTKIGKISVQSDRVKVKDSQGTLRAKVKKKDNGFKLYAADDSVVLKGKLSGEQRLKIKRDDGQELAKLDGSTGTISGAAVEARVIAGGVSIIRADASIATLRGDIRVEPALLWALETLDPYQRAALLIFVKEVW